MLRTIDYPVVDIFRTIQGEGYNVGRTAIFIRLAGCNKTCSWCDTDHTTKEKLTAEEIVNRVVGLQWNLWDLIVITGGEPTIHDLEPICRGLIQINAGVEIAVETNGTNSRRLLDLKEKHLINWVTLSPKDINDACVEWEQIADEFKVVMEDKNPPHKYEPHIPYDLFDNKCFVQPCSQDFAPAIKYVLEHPQWRLSVQIQKIVDIP